MDYGEDMHSEMTKELFCHHMSEDSTSKFTFIDVKYILVECLHRDLHCSESEG